jgi:hypothetical protein
MNEMKKMGFGTGRKSFEPLSWHLPGQTEEYQADISPDSRRTGRH